MAKLSSPWKWGPKVLQCQCDRQHNYYLDIFIASKHMDEAKNPWMPFILTNSRIKKIFKKWRLRVKINSTLFVIKNAYSWQMQDRKKLLLPDRVSTKKLEKKDIFRKKYWELSLESKKKGKNAHYHPSIQHMVQVLVSITREQKKKKKKRERERERTKRKWGKGKNCHYLQLI